MNILDYNQFYLVGIKGVAMTSLAQCLKDAGKQVRGSDVAEAFVTQALLDQGHISLDVGFDQSLPTETDCVVYTAAHQGQFNPQVKAAQERQIPTFSQAEAIASLFNQKEGIAVCGVGGKSTTSAMITWILDKTNFNPSFSVGVGNIPGLDKTGHWDENSRYFVAEADEYVIDATAPSRGKEITPRFSFMNPFMTVCTNLRYDHPDVYKDFGHTQRVFQKFFSQIKPGGCLIYNIEDEAVMTPLLASLTTKLQTLTFGQLPTAQLQLKEFNSRAGLSTGTITFDNHEYQLELVLPGAFNMLNAVAALAVTTQLGVTLNEAVASLKSFRSTLRRSEFIGEKHGVKFYDDYAHHPNEIKHVIQAFKEWYPDNRLVVAFQSHTFSRTKALFDDFVTAFDQADEVAMMDIFPSAREPFDSSITSDMLCEAIEQHQPELKAQNYKTIEHLAEYLQTTLQAGDVCLSVGAGTIYQIHDLIKS